MPRTVLAGLPLRHGAKPMLAGTDQATVTRLDYRRVWRPEPVSTLPRIAALACASLLLAGCGDATVPTPTLAPATSAATVAPSRAQAPTIAPTAAASPTAAPIATATPTAAAATGNFSLGDSVWWSGFEIAFRGGTYDAGRHSLRIDASFTNNGTQGSELRNLSDGTTVRWNSQDLPGFVSSAVVGPGATLNAQITVAVPPGFNPTTAVLTFGKSDEHQALVPLNGDETFSERMSQLSFSGKITMGKYVTFTVTSAWMVPASCSGYPDRIKYGPMERTAASLVVFGTAKSTDSTNYRQIDRGFLLLPDGSKLASDPQMSISLPLRAVLPNEALCFAVPIPTGPGYQVGMHEYRSNATGTLPIDLT